MPDKTFLVHVKVENRQVRKKLEEIIKSDPGLRVQAFEKTRRPDLVIYELGDDTEGDFQVLQSLMNSDALGEVFLTSDRTDSQLLLKAMRMGVKEFLLQPLNEQEVRQALAGFKVRSGQSVRTVAAERGKVISVMGSKGGVGTTTVAVNLAVSLAESKAKQSIALVDLNAVVGEIPLFLAVRPSYHWGEIMQNIGRLDSAFLMNIMVRHGSGLYVLPSPSKLNGYPVATPDTMQRVLNVLRDMFDVVVIDGGQSMESAHLKVIEMSDTLLIVSILSLPCLHNTHNLLRSLKGLSILPQDRIRVVINRHLKKSDVSISEAEESIKQEIFWSIPNDYKATMSAINQGKPLSKVGRKAPVTRSLTEMANCLVGEDREDTTKRTKRFRWH
ncbi:MAG: AAA family ATPase [Deltaproteobacteria bacterium]|nr:MAG: AAA family ATPase [Deltaproteobacteria bacterium]